MAEGSVAQQQQQQSPIDAWVPPNVRQQFIPYYIEQPVNHPELYDADAQMAIIKLFMIFGRAGNDKGATLSKAISTRGIHCKLVTVMSRDEHTAMKSIQHTIDQSSNSNDGVQSYRVVVVEYAEQFNKADSYEIHQWLLSLPKALATSRVILCMCYGVVPNGLPPDICNMYSTQVYWTCPDKAWYQAFYKYTIERYRDLVAHSTALRVRVDMRDDDYAFLADSSHFHTIEEVKRFVNIVFASVHRLGNVYPCNTRGMPQAEQVVHEDCVTEIDGALYRVINRTRIREHHMKDKGGVYAISTLNTKQLEETFSVAARKGFLAEPETRHKVILYQDDDNNDDKAKEEEPEKKKIKLEANTGFERIVFDPKTGEEKVVGTDLKKDAFY